MVGNQDQRLVEAVIQPQHQRLQQLIFVGLQVDGALEVLPLLLQGADPVAGGGVPQHRQTGIEHEAVDGEPDALLAEVAQGQAVGLLQHLLLILLHQPEQHRQLMPARLMGADLQQLSHGLPRRQPVMLMQLAGELQLQPGGNRDAGLMALQVGPGALQFSEPQHGVEEPGPWPARLILVGTEGIVLGGSDPLGRLQQQIALEPIQPWGQRAILPLKQQVFTEGGSQLPLPQQNGGGQRAGQVA